MNWDISYLLQTSLLTLCVVICIPVSLHWNRSIPGGVRRYFYFLALVLLLESCVFYADHVLSSVPDSRYVLARTLWTALSYIVRPFMFYGILMIMTRDLKLKHRELILAIPALITFLVTLIGLFSNFVFYYDEENQLHHGPLMAVLYLALLAYLILIIVFNIRLRKWNRVESRTVYGIIALLFADMILSSMFPRVSVHEQVMVIAIFLYYIFFISIYNYQKVEQLNTSISETEDRLTKQMLDQSIETLAYTIDAKDRTTKGHSMRVAKYARMIADIAKKDQEFCRQAYLAGLVHDIGKIVISDEIINKTEALTEEETEIMKTHTEKGAKILEKMRDYPFLQESAEFHHERFDGSGFPKGLRGLEIPEIARIIAVVNEYDVMTSYGNGREVMDQADVKQEIWKASGTKFDPVYAKLMIALIDSDVNYDLREKAGEEDEILIEQETEVSWQTVVPTEIKADNQIMAETSVFRLGEFASYVNNWETPTKSVRITDHGCKLSFMSKTDEEAKYLWFAPSIILFASNSGKIQNDEYEELAVIESMGYSWANPPVITENTAFIKNPEFTDWDNWIKMNKQGMEFTVSVWRDGSTIRLTIDSNLLRIVSELELPEDYGRNLYISATGERCSITDVKFE